MAAHRELDETRDDRGEDREDDRLEANYIKIERALKFLEHRRSGSGIVDLVRERMSQRRGSDVQHVGMTMTIADPGSTRPGPPPA